MENNRSCISLVEAKSVHQKDTVTKRHVILEDCVPIKTKHNLLNDKGKNATLIVVQSKKKRQRKIMLPFL